MHGIAVIGLGTVGLRYIEQFEAHDRFRLIGGFDVSAEAGSVACERFGLALAESAEALVTAPEVDVVYIAVPPLHHRHYVDMVADADKAMLCEKPLGVDDADGQAMVDRVAGERAAVNFVFAAAPSAQAMIQAVSSASTAVAGADLRVHFEHWPRAWQARAEWLRDRDQGGWVREVVSHYVFLLLRLFGPPAIEASNVVFPADGSSEQRLVAALRCGDVPVSLLGSSDSAGADEVEFTVRGHDRSWRLTNWYEYATAELDGSWTPGLSVAEASRPAAYGAQLDQLDRLVSGQPNNLATFDEALAVQRVVEALLDSEH